MYLLEISQPIMLIVLFFNTCLFTAAYATAIDPRRN